MRKLLCGGLLALAAVRPSVAAEVTEVEYLSGIGAHPAVRALDTGLARAEAARREAGLLANPRLEFWREFPAPGARLTNWTLAWTPPLDGRRGPGRRAAEAGLAATREETALAWASVRGELRRAFAEWSVASARVEILGQAAERIAALAEQERQRARLGEESGLSARRLALAAAEAAGALGRARAELARATALARAWNPEVDGEPRLPDLPPPTPPLDAPLARVAAAEHRLEQARQQSRLEGRLWGFPTLQAGVQRIEENGLVRSEPLIAAFWSLPLFDRRQAQRAEAGRNVDAAAARLEHERRIARAEVDAAQTAYATLHSAASDARAQGADAARVVEAATAAWRAGESSLTDLLDALRAAFETREQALDLHAAALAAHRDLEAAIGQPLESPGQSPDGGVR